MKIEQRVWTQSDGWSAPQGTPVTRKAQIVFVFGGTNTMKEKRLFDEVRELYPGTPLFGCSTSGEIWDTKVMDDTLMVTAVSFDVTNVMGSQVFLDAVPSSFEAGRELARSIDQEGLTNVIVLSDGLNVNGSNLVKGLAENLPAGVVITGGLAGDADLFRETYVFWDKEPVRQAVAMIGLYGDHLNVGSASISGWDPFGPERLITKSRENILYELDGQSALNTYKKYLGDAASGLPATALLFPLSVRVPGRKPGIVRTVLSIDEREQTMTFAGDIQEGARVRFMKANPGRLIDGARRAAQLSGCSEGSAAPELAIIISCVGRKLVLRQRVEEEVEAVRDELGETTALTGFYSYGEIGPLTPDRHSVLHNQTMTITTFTER